MGDRNLQSSIWAPGNRIALENRQNISFDSDWSCTSCSFSNFQWRKDCFRCLTPKSGQNPTNGHSIAYSQNEIAGRKIQPELWPVKVQDLPLQHQPDFKAADKGLTTSRWAPRRNGRGDDEVWTRAVPFTTPSRISSPSKRVANIPLHSPDLGLPYQVQHYILALMQRLLEEGCYDFALRWVPQILVEKRWDCSEAVELSTWRTFLPTTIPPTAIKQLSNYTLQAALADAVRIRNSAVHRHLCDNHEIRKMALQGQDLMSMFSDTTRQNKFYQLWTELNVWNLADDLSAARTRLEKALQEISERPMDDMDWTPNSVSLEEVPAVLENIQNRPGHYADEMELD